MEHGRVSLTAQDLLQPPALCSLRTAAERTWKIHPVA